MVKNASDNCLKLSTVAALVDNENITYMLKNYQDISVVDKFYRQERIDDEGSQYQLSRDGLNPILLKPGSRARDAPGSRRRSMMRRTEIILSSGPP